MIHPEKTHEQYHSQAVLDAEEEHRDSIVRVEEDMEDEELPHLTWSGFHKFALALESMPVNYSVMILLGIDTLFVLGEIMVSLMNDQNCPPWAVDDPRQVSLDLAEHILYWGSIAILILFASESFAKLICFGPMFFWRSPLNLMDATIVSLSLGLTLGLSGSIAQNFTEFLILLRFWRVVRIINTIIISMEKRFSKERVKYEAKITEFAKLAGISDWKAVEEEKNGEKGKEKKKEGHGH